MRIDSIGWLGNFPRHNAYRNKHDIYSNLLDSLRSHLKIQVFWAAYIAHKWPSPGAREMLPPSPKFAKLSTGQIMEHCGPSSFNYQHQPPQHLHGFDPITSCSSTHNGISHCLQKALPQNPSICLFMPFKSHRNVTPSWTSVAFFHTPTKISLFFFIFHFHIYPEDKIQIQNAQFFSYLLFMATPSVFHHKNENIWQA